MIGKYGTRKVQYSGVIGKVRYLCIVGRYGTQVMIRKYGTRKVRYEESTVLRL